MPSTKKHPQYTDTDPSSTRVKRTEFVDMRHMAYTNKEMDTHHLMPRIRQQLGRPMFGGNR